MEVNYESLCRQAAGILEEEPWYFSCLSNLSALIMENLPQLNWAGFYLMRSGRLTVGPFQGKPACIHIAPGKGVCGTAVAEDKTILVPDVHEFPGHIACDSASASEIVIPIHQGGGIIGVLDIDSPVKNRFDKKDQAGLESLVRLIEKSLETL